MPRSSIRAVHDGSMRWYRRVLPMSPHKSAARGMTAFERSYQLASHFLPPLYKHVRHEVRRLTTNSAAVPMVLDAGGRKSPYTIGLPIDVVIADLPRESELQHQLHLGVGNSGIAKVRARRSNIGAMVFTDMTCGAFRDASFDGVLAVEVLEHVDADDAFLREVARVLRPDGWYVMTTPNGDWIPKPHPDHRRHYARSQLLVLLARHFDEVIVSYAVVTGRWRRHGLASWSPRHPYVTARSALSNVVNGIQSRRRSVASQPQGTSNLIAVCRRPLRPS